MRRFVLALTLVVLGCSQAFRQTALRTDDIRAMEQRTFDLVNEYRIANRLRPLVWNNIISERALRHSEKMASNMVQFSHEGFDARILDIATHMQVRNGSENLAVSFGFKDPAAQFLDGWIKSPGHLENIVGEFELTGVGIAQSLDGSYYATQIFIQKR